MPPISWSAALSCGELALDRQHEELIDIVNALERALDAGDDSGTVDDCARRLLAYARFHFATEERLMLAGSLPASIAGPHIVQHLAFANRVEAFAAAIGAAGLRERGLDLLGYLHRWLQDHILKTDRALIAALTGRPSDD